MNNDERLKCIKDYYLFLISYNTASNKQKVINEWLSSIKNVILKHLYT